MNYPEFRAAIARVGVSNRDLAKAIDMSEQTFYSKLSGQTEFKHSEIKKLAKELGLSLCQVNTIFFDGEVN